MTRLEKSGLAEKELAYSVLSLTGCCSIQIRVHTKNCNHKNFNWRTFQGPPTRSYNFTDSTKMHIPSLFYLGFKAWTDCLTNFSTFFSSLVLNCIRHWALCVNNLYTIPPLTTKKHQKTLSRPLHSKLKKIQGLFKDLLRNLRIFQGKMEFKDFSRTSPKMQGLFKTVWTLNNA